MSSAMPCALSRCLRDVFADEANEFRHGTIMNFQQALDSVAPLDLFPELRYNHVRVQVVLMNEKVVRDLRGHIPGSQRGVGEILEIEGNDGLSARAYRGCQHMAARQTTGKSTGKLPQGNFPDGHSVPARSFSSLRRAGTTARLISTPPKFTPPRSDCSFHCQTSVPCSPCRQRDLTCQRISTTQEPHPNYPRRMQIVRRHVPQIPS